MKYKHSLSHYLLALLSMVVLLGTPAMAQRYAVATGNWNSTNTWSATSGGAAGVSVPTSSDAVTIERGFTVTVDITNAACASLILGGSSNTGTLAFAASGNPALTVSGTVQVGATSSATAGGIITFQNGSSLTCSSLAMGNITTTAASTITMAAGGTLTINGILSAPGTGTHTWTRGTGTVVFGATNTLPNITTFNNFNNLTISAGTTTLARSLSTVSGAITVNAGATLALATFAIGGTAPPVGVTVYCGATTGSSITGTTGTLNLGGNVTVISAGTGTNGATIACPVGLVAARIFTVADDGTATADLTVSGVISGTFAFTKNGTGTIVLSGTNTFTGLTTINAGTLRCGVNNALSTGAVTVNDGGTLDLNGYSDAIGALTVNSGTIGGTVTTGAGTLTLGGNVTSTGGGSNATISGNIALGATRTFTVTNAADGLNVSAVISGASFGITKVGAGTLTLSGSNTFTGAVTISAGTLSANTLADAGTNSSLGTGSTTPAISIAATGTLRYTGTGHSTTRAIALTGSGGTLDASGSGAMTLSGGVTGNTFGLNLTGTGTGIESGVIATTTGTVTKNGTGTWTLSGINTYSGVTTIIAGILSVNSLANSGTNSSLGTGSTTPAISISTTGTLQYVGTGHSTSRAIVLTGSGGTLDASGSGTMTLSGGVTGNTFGLNLIGTGTGIESGLIATTTGTLTKNGTGTWILSGVNTYTGSTTINAGTLRCGVNNSLSTGGVTVNDGGVYDLNGFSDAIGALTVNSGTIGGTVTTGAGTLTLGGNVTSTGGGSNATISGNIALGATRTFTVTNAADGLNVSAVISGASFGITKVGAGTLTLSGSNTFTGAVTISAGTLSANTLADAGTNSSLGTGSTTPAISIAATGTLRYTGTGHSTTRAIALTGSGGTLDASGSGAMTLSGGVTGNTFGLNLTGTGTGIESGVIATTTGTVTKNGTGTWTLSGINTYSGVTTIIAGILNRSIPDFSTSIESYVDINGGYTIPSDTLIYTLKVHNTGSLVATSTSVVDSLPSYVAVVPGSISNSGTFAGGKITFPTFDLAVNDSAILQYRVTVDTTIADQYVATTVTAISSYGVHKIIYTSFTAFNRPQMTMTRSSNLSLANPGDTVTITTTYSNLGTTAATFVTVVDPTPGNTFYVPHSTIINGASMTDEVDGDAVSIISNQMLVNLGTVQPGQTGTIIFKVIIH